MAIEEINVHIGQVRIAHENQVLKTILGSCVGIGFIWNRKRICGLAHCLLPSCPSPSETLSGRFVDQAIPLLLDMMQIKTEDFSEIQAVLAGGGNMTSPADRPSDTLVGMQNLKKAEQIITSSKINLIYKNGGGEEGRRVFLFAADGSYKVEKIPRIHRDEPR